MRDDGNWIEPAIKIVLVISAVLALFGIYAVFHFAAKYW